jgi:predicted nucleic-acid-binding Zn-ribbon protein
MMVHASGARLMTKACPKCEGKMSTGIIVDQTYGGALPEQWQPGEAQKSFWTGLKQDKKAQLQVTTWRCERCGYLESYAA